ncbi:hypothetical protein [Mycolicibacterium cosmeticum]|uniref:hypothetical protein n=1 Tax=Mycolicibacterium cosmeticum TaxID=258533 RepID=UPI003204F950
MDPIDAAFDSLIAQGSAPWLVKRTGPHIIHRLGMDQPELINDTLPDGSMRLPRLDGTNIPGLVDNRGIACWYLPELRLLADEFEDVGFHFAATQTDQVTAENKPFNTAEMTFSFTRAMPLNIVELPDDAFIGVGDRQEVPDLTVTAVLALPITAQDGTTTDRILQCTVSDAASGNFFVTLHLTGDDVERAYVHFTRGGAAQLRVTATYSAYQNVVFPDPTFVLINDDTAIEALPAPPPQVEVDGVTFLLIGDGEHDSSPEAAAAPQVPPHLIRYFPVTAQIHRTIAVGKAFNTDTYRSRFTITAGDMTRPIIDTDDLTDFASARSEFRELTTLGDVQDRYPSLRRLFFGQVSGTVIAVPAAYGIVSGAKGVAARCDAIVDPSAITGCRFDFTFTLAPLVDPVDMAQLRADLTTVPEAAARTLQLTLPSGLDVRRSSTLDGFASGSAAFTDGIEPHTVAASVEITDTDTTPATTNVNLFLHQLATDGPTPLFGNLFIRVDDLLPQPVVAQAALNLRRTACSDELTATIAADPTPRASATNHGPFDLVMTRFAITGAAALRITALPDQVLSSGQSAILTTAVDDADSVEVSRTLALPSPLPKKQLLDLVAINTQVVDKLQHPLTVNATAVNFDADTITSIAIHFALTALPGLPIPTITLRPAHRVDFVHVAVPVTSAVTGLECTVSMTITDANGDTPVSLTHDFVTDPILIVTPGTLTP